MATTHPLQPLCARRADACASYGVALALSTENGYGVPAPASAIVAGTATLKPYELRHAFASLLAHEGRSVVYISKQLGHGADVSLDVYQHVIDELEDRPALAAEVAIREARKERKPLRRQS